MLTQALTSSSDPSPLSLEKQCVQSYLLSNGLTLLVQEDQSSPVVSVQAWCKAGSITEGNLLGCGASHLLEHMLFKGTTKRGNSEIAQTIQSVGGYVNAYTSFDRTVFYVDCPSSGWRTALDVLSDAIFHSTLPEEEFVKEQEVIRREFSMGFDNPQNVLFKSLFATAFQVHPYKYPVIGHLELFNKLTRQDILDYYHHFFVPNNLTFVITGDVIASEVHAFLMDATKTIERSILPDTYIPIEPQQLGRRELHLKFPTQVTRFMMAWHTPGLSHPDVFALDVLAIIAGEGVSSRLNQELVEKQKLLSGISAFSYSPAQSGIWGISALLSPDSKNSTNEVESAISTMLDDFKNHPVHETELAKARRKVMVGRASELKTVSGKAASIGNSWFTARDTSFDELYLQRISLVTAADLQRVAQTYLIPSHLSVVSLQPETHITTSLAATKVPAKSEPHLVQLNSGLRLVMLVDTKVPLVSVRVLIRGGSLAETGETSGISTLMTRLLSKGTTKHTAEQIATEIENLGGSIDTQSGSNSISISIEVLQTDLEKAIELLAEILLHANFPQHECEQEKRQQLTEIQLQEDKPTSVAQRHLKSALFGSHPYGWDSLGSVKNLEKITRSDLQNFHQSLLNPDHLVLTIGGSFSPEKARDFFTRYFPATAFSKTTTPFHHADPVFQGQGQTLELTTVKQQAVVMIGYPGVDIHSPDRAALELIDEALSDLASRLFIRIREKQSLAYFVGTQQIVGLQRGMFVYYAGTAPEKGEKVRDEILDEIFQMLSTGLDEGEVERARAKLLGQRLLQDQSASATVYKAGLNLLYGKDLDFEKQLNEKIRHLTRAEINASARKVFAEKNFICVMLKPEPNKK